MEKMLSCLRDCELEGCLYGLLAAMVPAARRQNKEGEGKLKWERAKEFLRPTSPPSLSCYGADKPHFVCDIISDVPGDSLAMPSVPSMMAVTHTIPVRSVLQTCWEEESDPT